MEQKHIVLVHNAFHGAWIWYKLKPMLESAGHCVTAMDLLASGTNLRPIEEVQSFQEYSKPLLEFMERIREGEKVMVVAISLGGISAALVADKYPDKIAVLVFVNAFMPDTNHTPSYVLDKFMENPPDWKDCKFSSYNGREDDTTITSVTMGPDFMRTFLYQQCPAEDYELAKMLTRRGSFFQEVLGKAPKLREEGYGSVKRVYIMGEEDKVLPKEFMSWEIQNYGVDKIYKIPDGDHMLMLSKPRQLLACLLEIAHAYA